VRVAKDDNQGRRWDPFTSQIAVAVGIIYLVLKIAVVVAWERPWSLAIIQAAGIFSVVAGVAVDALGELAGVAFLAVVAWRLLREEETTAPLPHRLGLWLPARLSIAPSPWSLRWVRARLDRMRLMNARDSAHIWVLAVIALFATPWLELVFLVVILVLLAAVLKWTDQRRKKWTGQRSNRESVWQRLVWRLLGLANKALWGIVALFAFVYGLVAILDSRVWLPAERITTYQEDSLVGYVFKTGDGWMTVLVEDRCLWFESEKWEDK
jgi:hypothetical protein